MENKVLHNGQAGPDIFGEIQRSDEVQDMIGAVPHWLVRSGISLILMVLIVLLAISWFVKYPDVLQAGVLITTDPAPITLVAKSSGPLLILVKEKQEVKKGDVLAVVRSVEDWRSVQELENDLLADEDIKGENRNLGTLQETYNRYSLALSQWQLFLATDHHHQRTVQLEKQLMIHKKLRNSMAQQLKITNAQYTLSSSRFKTDSLLFDQNVMSRVDFQQSKNEYLQDKKALEQVRASFLDQELRIEELAAVLTDLKMEKILEQNQLSQVLTNTRRELLAQIRDWKMAHFFTAPEDGKIGFLDILHDNKHVQDGEALFSLVPQHGRIMAIATLPVTGSGKVEIGQPVNIKLDHYPYEQYGMLQGVIKDFPILPVNGHYQVRLSLPDRLKTTYGKELDIRQNLTGSTEVITEDLRLMEKMFHWLKVMRHRIE